MFVSLCTPRSFIPFLFLTLANLSSLTAWDNGLMTLTKPSETVSPLMVELELGHRFLEVLPLQGVNALLRGSVSFLNHYRAAVLYQTKEKEKGGELSAWFPVGDFDLGASVAVLWGQDHNKVGLPGYFSQVVTVFGSGFILPRFLELTLNAQYDPRIPNINGGLGMGITLVPDSLDFLLETNTAFSTLRSPVLIWNTGILVKTPGHQFILFIGNGNDLRLHSALSGLQPELGDVSFGFMLRRKFDFFFY